MKVVVTGGAGFIGANLCAALVESGVSEVVAYDNLSTGTTANLQIVPKARLLRSDILDSVRLVEAFTGTTSVVHLAARPSVPRSLSDPFASHEANATGTLRVLEAARIAGVEQVIVASSSSVYGGSPVMPKHEDAKPSPLSPYAASKLAAESYALAWQHSFGLRTLAFRFFNVFGPLQAADHAYAAVVPAFIASALADMPLVIHGDGLQTRDFTYVESVTAVIVDSIHRLLSHNEPVNLAFGTQMSLLQLIGRLEFWLGKELRTVHQPMRLGDVRHSRADDQRLRRLFPTVQPVEFDYGLERTIAWFQGQTRFV